MCVCVRAVVCACMSASARRQVQAYKPAAAIGDMLGMSAADILSHPHCLIGSVDFICDELQRRRERYGISYVAVLDDGENNMVETFAPVVARLAGT